MSRELALEDVDEAVSDACAFFLRVGDALEVAQEIVHGIDDAQVEIEMALEGFLDQVTFALAQQAVVDEDAGQLFSDGVAEHGRDDGGIDATGKPADDALVADQFTDAFGFAFQEVGHAPRAVAAADAKEEIAEDVRAVGACV